MDAAVGAGARVWDEVGVGSGVGEGMFSSSRLFISCSFSSKLHTFSGMVMLQRCCKDKYKCACFQRACKVGTNLTAGAARQ